MIHIDRPADWQNLSIDEYIQLQDLLTDEQNTKEEQEDLMMQELQIVYGVNPYQLDLRKFKSHIKALEFLSKPIPKMKVKDSYMLNGAKYYLHKKLEEFKVAQYIDFTRIAQDNKGVEAYPEYIALFLTPSSDGDYGDGYDVQQVVDDIRKYMSIADALSIATFFFKSSVLSIALFQWFSMRKATRAIKDRKTRRELRRKTKQLMRLTLGE